MADIDSVEPLLAVPANVDFPPRPIYSGAEAPCRFEAEIYNCETRGQIPAAVNGTYYRTMPDQEWAPEFNDDVFFNGDGVVDAFRFKNGVVDFKQKFCRTRKFVIERAARKSLFGKFFNMYVADPRVKDEIRGTSNTHIIYYNQMLLAMSENSLPFAMDPDTLDTIGAYDFQKQFKPKSFSAHPKVDPFTGELMVVAYQVKGDYTKDLAYYAFDRNGVKIDECWFEAPYCGMTHDIGVTDNWIIVVITPNAVNSPEKQKAGAQHFEWDETLPLTFGLLPRRNPRPEDVKWFQYKNAYGVHVGNAFDGDDGCIYLDIPVADSNRMFYFNPPNKPTPKDDIPQSSYLRFRFDPSSTNPKLDPENLFKINGEFPVIDSRFFGKKYSKFFLVVAPPAQNKVTRGPMATINNTITMCDIDDRVSRSWYAGPMCGVAEVAFCPRSADAPEGDGFIMAVVNRKNKALTSMVILDTAQMEAGPIGIINLPFRLRTGTHGSWVPGSLLPRDADLCDMQHVSKELIRQFNPEAALYGFETVGNSMNDQ